jgi:hypothetical protein
MPSTGFSRWVTSRGGPASPAPAEHQHGGAAQDAEDDRAAHGRDRAPLGAGKERRQPALTTATSAENTRTTIGGELTVFNLREALEQNAGRDVFVVDPYLDRSMMSATAAGLLRSLNCKK